MDWVQANGYLSAPSSITVQWFEAAQPQLRFAELVSPIDVVQGVGGDTATFPKIYDLIDTLDNSYLDEDLDIPISDFDRNRGTIVLREYGRGTRVSAKAAMFSAYNVDDMALGRLRNHMARKLNRLQATAAKTTFVKYTPTSVGSATQTYTISTDGTTLTTASGRNINALDLLTIKAYMMDSLHVPVWQGDGAGMFDYIYYTTETSLMQMMYGDAAAHMLSDMRSAYQQYREASPLIAGSWGIWNRILFKTDNDSISTTLGATTLNGEGLMCGDKPVVGAYAVSPEIRREVKGQGRQDYLYWYAVMGFAHTMGSDSIDIANAQARAVHVTGA